MTMLVSLIILLSGQPVKLASIQCAEMVAYSDEGPSPDASITDAAGRVIYEVPSPRFGSNCVVSWKDYQWEGWVEWNEATRSRTINLE